MFWELSETVPAEEPESEISEAAAEANVDVMIISEMIRTKKERTVAPDTGGHLNKALLIFVIAVLSHFS
ncbi:hypothetical protein J5839_01440 [Methanosarcinaceae archaeon]|nr:hypothetical protein [Methanosarcinaceae archaeon]